MPTRVIDKPPTAGLWVGQTDEAEMGFSYDTLEQYLTKGPLPLTRPWRSASNGSRQRPITSVRMPPDCAG